MKQNDAQATLALLTPEAVRQRCNEVFMAAAENALNFFQFNRENFNKKIKS